MKIRWDSWSSKDDDAVMTTRSARIKSLGMQIDVTTFSDTPRKATWSVRLFDPRWDTQFIDWEESADVEAAMPRAAVVKAKREALGFVQRRLARGAADVAAVLDALPPG